MCGRTLNKPCAHCVGIGLRGRNQGHDSRRGKGGVVKM